MASPSVTLFAFFALFLCSGVLAQDHFFLYLRWPGGICVRDDQCCFPSTWSRQDDFVINYLAVRANESDGDSLACSQTQFRVNNVQLIIEDMYTYWPSLSCPSDPGLRDWQSAWEVNGACTGLLQKDYFKAALALRASANLLPILANKGIVPSNHKSYKLSEVENAINEELGGAATLNCGSNSSSFIRDVRLCVDETATRFVECPVKRASTCSEMVRLEPLAQVNDEL